MSKKADKIAALDAGADDYMTKTFQPGRAAGPDAGGNTAAPALPRRAGVCRGVISPLILSDGR